MDVHGDPDRHQNDDAAADQLVARAAGVDARFPSPMPTHQAIRAQVQQLHDKAAHYFEEHDVPGGWLDDDGAWKDWESESEGSAAEARRDAFAEVLALIDG